MQAQAITANRYTDKLHLYACPTSPKGTLSWEAEGDSGYLTTSKFNIKYEKTESIFINSQYIGKLPMNLNYLGQIISKSESILLLKDNWDDEGSVGYYQQVLLAATKFLIDYANHVYKEQNAKIDVPKIYPGPKGSIDIIWENEIYRLVINIDKNGEDGMFYGDSKNSQITEGQFKLGNFHPSLLPIPV